MITFKPINLSAIRSDVECARLERRSETGWPGGTFSRACTFAQLKRARVNFSIFGIIFSTRPQRAVVHVRGVAVMVRAAFMDACLYQDAFSSGAVLSCHCIVPHLWMHICTKTYSALAAFMDAYLYQDAFSSGAVLSCHFMLRIDITSPHTRLQSKKQHHENIQRCTRAQKILNPNP